MVCDVAFVEGGVGGGTFSRLSPSPGMTGSRSQDMNFCCD